MTSFRVYVGTSPQTGSRSEQATPWPFVTDWLGRVSDASQMSLATTDAWIGDGNVRNRDVL